MRTSGPAVGREGRAASARRADLGHRSGYTGQGGIAAIKPHLKRIPLIGNGDLDSPAKVIEAFRRYGVDGVMIARASLGRPWLFQQVQAALRGEPVPPEPPIGKQRQLMLQHYQLVY